MTIKELYDKLADKRINVYDHTVHTVDKDTSAKWALWDREISKIEIIANEVYVTTTEYGAEPPTRNVYPFESKLFK